MHGTRRLWITLGVVVVTTFLLLGFFGREVYRSAPPIPDRVTDASGEVLMTGDDILEGQTVWQGMGGQQVGSIWGHGAYQAPDWSADWLHRECIALLDIWSRRQYGRSCDELDAEQRAGLEGRLKVEMRRNSYDAETGTLVVSDDRRQAIETTATHYRTLFGGGADPDGLRESYALREVSLENESDLVYLSQFFFWTSWACATERSEGAVTYSNNWPHEPLIGNVPSGANILWSVLSVVLLLAAVGALVWFQHSPKRNDGEADPEAEAPATDPFDGIKLTPSMRATAKYCVIVIALFVVQVILGAITAHYTVEGQTFFGLPLGEWLPYAVTRTWHLQLAVFWIATAFLAAGLFLAPAVSGHEPRFQRLGVNVLFGALLVVVTGSLIGEWMAVHGKLPGGISFLLGHQGYEYVDLGRVWQIGLFVGLMLWLVLMLRALAPALRRRDERRGIVTLFAASSAAIGLFYGAGFFFGAKTHLTVMEYWRWWVVHLWVEGFMEVFATAACAFIFVRLGLVRARSATRAVLFATSIFLIGGIPGTFHHLYFSGTPVSIMAIGACFSALEVVPLVLIGKEAWETLRLREATPWMANYKWPMLFFVGVAFWNFVGAGLFGFLINPPVALYYMQGLNTTAVHAHTALFGVYGLLALGLILVLLRRYQPNGQWKDGALRFSFWAMNGGLALMVLLSLLPIGLLQAHASIETGLWYARSAEFLQQPLLENLRWLRIVGDTVFLAGVGSLAWFVIGLKTGRSFVRVDDETAAVPDTEVLEIPVAAA